MGASRGRPDTFGVNRNEGSLAALAALHLKETGSCGRIGSDPTPGRRLQTSTWRAPVVTRKEGAMARSLFARDVSLRAPTQRTETGRPILLAYVFALALIVAVVALKRIVNTPLGNDAPFLFMMGSTVLVTWYGGRSAGLLAAVAGALAVNYFFLPPYDDWHSTPAATEQTVLFSVENALVAWLTSLLIKARKRAEVGAERMRRLYAANSEASGARSIADVATIIAREGTAAMGATAGAVFVAPEAHPVLRLVAQFAADPAAQAALVDGMREVPVNGLLPIATVFKTGEPVCIGKAAELRSRSLSSGRCLARGHPAARSTARRCASRGPRSACSRSASTASVSSPGRSRARLFPRAGLRKALIV